eukprot:GEMP01109399.1.p3 GENE.GEMP01109399.1~~GEMP01109399.1.p3  ORF type:complete len:105 (-),score=23.16 GEMP01109399.1:207-521(-)
MTNTSAHNGTPEPPEKETKRQLTNKSEKQRSREENSKLIENKAVELQNTLELEGLVIASSIIAVRHGFHEPNCGAAALLPSMRRQTCMHNNKDAPDAADSLAKH